MTIGSSGQQTDFFDGTLDEFAIYPSALAASHVEAHYTASGRTISGDAVRERHPFRRMHS